MRQRGRSMKKMRRRKDAGMRSTMDSSGRHQWNPYELQWILYQALGLKGPRHVLGVSLATDVDPALTLNCDSEEDGNRSRFLYGTNSMQPLSMCLVVSQLGMGSSRPNFWDELVLFSVWLMWDGSIPIFCLV